MFDEFVPIFDELYKAISTLMVKTENKVLEEVKNGKHDNEFVSKSRAAEMHFSHAIGELIEAKSFLIDELSPMDIGLKKQYEAEMDTALENFGQTVIFNEILNSGSKN